MLGLLVIAGMTEARETAATCFSVMDGWMDLGALEQRDEDLAMTELIAGELRN